MTRANKSSRHPLARRRSASTAAPDQVLLSQNPLARRTPLHLITMQRTLGNRLTRQLLAEVDSAPAPAAGDQAPIQRLISEADMIAQGGERTTGLFGGAKGSLYNTLLDALRRFDLAKANPAIGADMLITLVGMVAGAAKAWMESHGSEKKKQERATAVKGVWVEAAKLEKALVRWRTDWLAHEDMVAWYADPAAWALFKQLSARNFTDENTDFYERVQIYRQTGEGKQAIYAEFIRPDAPRLINISCAAIEQIEADLAGESRALFDVAIEDLVQVWSDLYSKARNDLALGGFLRSQLEL
jgi:hypothetical protein